MHQASRTHSMRRALILALHTRGFEVPELTDLRLVDVVRSDGNADYLEAADRLVRRRQSEGTEATSFVETDEELRRCLEDYLNAPHTGRPFVDYRPDIGQHLLPSPVTGEGLGARSLRKILSSCSKSERRVPCNTERECGGASPST